MCIFYYRVAIACLFLASANEVLADTEQNLEDLITQKAKVFDHEFSRSPVLAILSFGGVTANLDRLKDGPPPYPKPNALRKNTPWTTDQWASFQTANLRQPETPLRYGSNLFLSFGQDYYSFIKTRLTLKSSRFYVASPRALNADKTVSACFAPEAIWALVRCGDQLIFETNSGDYHAVQLLRINRDNETAEIVDAWPQQFLFEKEKTKKMHNGATIVIVPKDKFLGRLAQVVFVEERSFPLALISAAERKIAPEQLSEAACALALQLSDGASLADADTALAILEVASRKSVGHETERFQFARTYITLMRRAIVSETITGGSISDGPTLREFQRRSETDNRFLGTVNFREIVKAANDQQLLALGEKYEAFDPTAAQNICDILVERNSESVEWVMAVIVSSRCDLWLGNLERAKSKLAKVGDKLKTLSESYVAEMKSNGLESLLEHEERQSLLQTFLSIRPDLELKRKGIEKAKALLADCEREIANPATTLRLGPGVGSPAGR